MILDAISTKYRRSAIGLLVLGSLLSFALGQRVGHGHTAALNVVRTQSIPVITAHAIGDIGTAVPQQMIKRATTLTTPLVIGPGVVTSQGGQTSPRHGHGHGKGG